jgi:Uma2 family endonuclease
MAEILKVPYYILYDRYSGVLRAFCLVEDSLRDGEAEQYQVMEIEGSRLWLPELKIGLG